MTPSNDNELPSGFLPFTAGQGEGGDALPHLAGYGAELFLIGAIWLASVVLAVVMYV